MLKIIRLHKRYSDHTILNVIELEIHQGIFWVKGANGSGKSTLLKIIAGMIPFEGDVEIDSINLRKHPTDYRRLVNYVEAEPLYPSFLTGLDLIQFFTSVRAANKGEVDRLIEKFHIGLFVQNKIGTYSSGMVKKLSLVLAFVGQPKFILLDEPLVTIDKDTVPILYELIEEYFAKGTSFIFTSHQSFEIPSIPIQELLVKDQSVCYLS